MKDNSKLIVTVTTANSWIFPDVKNWATNDDDLVRDVIDCYEAGASIAHIHLPRGREKIIVEKVRDQCDIIIQAGMSSDSIPEREGDFQAKPEMMSIILNHHDEHFPNLNVNKLHSLEELENYCKKCDKFGIKPEWEVWNTGSYWNLRYLIEKELIKRPHFMTLFFNWPGGTWSPPTIEEYLHRIKYIPKNSIYSVSVMGNEQLKILSFVINNGGNIRVGTEDFPFVRKGKIARNNSQIVKHFVDLSKRLGREIADPSEARKIIGIH
ncbi:MAG: 3-keto-5-aminohexanoate cleavage protein [Candidatus Lokiarchaeota archaeon]